MRINGPSSAKPKQEPEKVISKPRSSATKTQENQAVRQTEWNSYVDGPGSGMNIKTGKRYSEVRRDLEGPPVAYEGVHAGKGSTRVDNVKNPDRKDGRWDPHEHMPRMVFDHREDAFPVSPSFDDDDKLQNNRAAYSDGVIGGDQKLSSAFSVTKKGDYTVHTYNQYYAHNKAANYHKNDYSTVQVYLKPGRDGKLAPQYLATLTHHGSQLTRWKDLKKDADGRPVVKVQLGSHALQPIGHGQDIPKDGLHVTGDGRAILDGKTLPHRLHLDGFQDNVDNVQRLDPQSDAGRARLEAMQWGAAAIDPLLPKVFEDNPHHKHVADVGMRVKRAASKAGGAVKDTAEDVANAGLKRGKKLVKGVRGLF